MVELNRTVHSFEVLTVTKQININVLQSKSTWKYLLLARSPRFCSDVAARDGSLTESSSQKI